MLNTVKLLIDAIIVWCILVLNCIFVGTVMFRNQIKKNPNSRSLCMLSLSHLPNGLVVIPIQFLNELVFKLNETYYPIPCNHILVTIWIGIEITTMAEAFFCFYQLLLTKQNVKEYYSGKIIRILTVALLTVWTCGSIFITSIIAYKYSDSIEICILKESYFICCILTLVVFIGPFTMSFVCYMHLFPRSDGYYNRIMSKVTFSSSKVESATSLLNLDNVGKIKWSRILFFSKSSSLLSQADEISNAEQLVKEKSTENHKNVRILADIKRTPGVLKKENIYLVKAKPDIEPKTQKPIGIFSSKCKTYDNSSSIIAFINFSYIFFWSPYIVVSFIEMLSSFKIMNDTIWTIQFGYCNSISLPIILGLYLKLHKSELVEKKVPLLHLFKK